MKQRVRFGEAKATQNRPKFWSSLALICCLLTATGYLLSNNGRTARGAHSQESADQTLPLAAPPVTTDVFSRSQPSPVAASTHYSAPARTPTTTVVPPASKPPAEIDRHMAERWLESVATYHEADRAKVLDALEESLAQRGPGVVFELKRGLESFSPYRTTERAATFHALGRLGQTLLSSDDPDAPSALATIQNVAKEALALPAYLPPDPELHTETMAPAELHSALHLGVLVETEGKLSQPNIVSKVAAIQMLTAVGGADALKQLQALQQQPDNPVGIQLVVERAIALVSHE